MAETITVDVSGFREFRTNIAKIARGRKAGPKLRRALRRSMTKTKTPVLKAAKRETPKDKGVLRLSLRAKVGTSGDTVWSVVGPRRGKFQRTVKKQKVGVDAFYAHMVEGGTKPHAIPKIAKTTRAKKRKLLVFEAGGKQIMTRRVRHPGMKARPFLQRAGKAGFTRATRIFITTFRGELVKAVQL